MKEKDYKHSMTFAQRFLEGKESKAKIRDEERAYKKRRDIKDETRYDRLKKEGRERRGFLDMVAKAGVSMPLLRSSSVLMGVFASRHALAQDTARNVVFCYASQGCDGDQWLPANASTSNTVSSKYFEYDVAKYCQFRHVDTGVEGHASARQALGDPTSSWQTQKDSYDIRIADVIGKTTPYKRIYLGADADSAVKRGEQSRLMYCSGIEDGGANDSQPSPIHGPQAAFDRLFGNAPDVSSDDSYKDVFAAHAKAIQSVKNKLSSEERSRLEAHEDAITAITKKFAQQEETPFDINACKNGLSINGGNTLQSGKAQADIIVAALACGLTNVATLQVGDNKAYFGWDPCFCDSIHDNASHGGNRGFFNATMASQQEVSAYLLKRLSETPHAAGGTLLDHTVFASVNCMGNGSNHSSGSSPWLLATGINTFKTGFGTGNGGRGDDFVGAIPVGLGIEGELEHTGNPNSSNLLA